VSDLVLVVEDDPANAVLVDAILSSVGGFEVVCSDDGDEVLTLIHDRPVVAVLMDVSLGSTRVAGGSLGSDSPIYLPEGDYRVELHSSPPRSMPVSLAPRDRLSLTLEKAGNAVSHFEQRDQIGYRSCEDVVASIERLEAGQESLHSATDEVLYNDAD